MCVCVLLCVGVNSCAYIVSVVFRIITLMSSNIKNYQTARDNSSALSSRICRKIFGFSGECLGLVHIYSYMYVNTCRYL